MDESQDPGHGSSFPKFVNPSYFGGSACILLNISLVLFIIAFASPFWFESDGSYYVGLWQACYKMPKDANSGPTTNSTTVAAADKWKCLSAQSWISDTAPGFENDWLAGVEAILIISLIFLVVTSVALILFVGSSPMRREIVQGIVFVSFCLTFTTACFSLTAVIVCGVLVTQDDSAVFRADLSWSYCIAATSTCITWFCTFALLAEVIRVMAASPVNPTLGPMSAQQSFHAQYRSLELRESVASNLNAYENEAVGGENEVGSSQNEASAVQNEAGVQDGAGYSELVTNEVSKNLYESLGILPSQFSSSDV